MEGASPTLLCCTCVKSEHMSDGVAAGGKRVATEVPARVGAHPSLTTMAYSSLRGMGGLLRLGGVERRDTDKWQRGGRGPVLTRAGASPRSLALRLSLFVVHARRLSATGFPDMLWLHIVLKAGRTVGALRVPKNAPESPHGRKKERPNQETRHIVATVSATRMDHPSKRSPWRRR